MGGTSCYRCNCPTPDKLAWERSPCPSKARPPTDQGQDPSHELLQHGGEDEDPITNQEQAHPHLEGGEPVLLLHVEPEASPVGCKCVEYPKVAVQLLGGHT